MNLPDKALVHNGEGWNLRFTWQLVQRIYTAKQGRLQWPDHSDVFSKTVRQYTEQSLSKSSAQDSKNQPFYSPSQTLETTKSARWGIIPPKCVPSPSTCCRQAWNWIEPMPCFIKTVRRKVACKISTCKHWTSWPLRVIKPQSSPNSGRTG